MRADLGENAFAAAVDAVKRILVDHGRVKRRVGVLIKLERDVRRSFRAELRQKRAVAERRDAAGKADLYAAQ